MADPTNTGQAPQSRAFAILVANYLAFLLNLALPLLLVRYFSVRDYGLVRQIFLVIATAINILPLGIGMTAYYFLPRESEERCAAVVFNIVCVHLIMGTAVFLAFTFLPSSMVFLIGSKDLTDDAALIGLVTLLWMTGRVLEILPLANNDQRFAVTWIVLSQLSRTVILLAAAASIGTVHAILMGALLLGLVQSVVLFMYLSSRFSRLLFSFNMDVVKLQISYALPVGFATLCGGLLYDLHNYFVSRRFGPEAFAVYSVGCALVPWMTVIRDSFNLPTIRDVSHLQKDGRIREIVLLTAQTGRYIAAFCLPLYVFLLVAGMEVLIVLFTDRYVASWPILMVHLTVLPWFVLVPLWDPILRAYADYGFLLKVRSVLLVLVLPALWLGSAMGLTGVIVVATCFALADQVCALLRARRIVGLSWRDAVLFKDVGKIGLASALAGVAAATARWLLVGRMNEFALLVVLAALFGCVYLALILQLHVVSAEERSQLRRQVSALRKLIGLPPDG